MHRFSRNRMQRRAVAAPTDPHLVYAVIALLLVFGILQVDIHRDALLKLGVMIGHEQLDSRFLGP